MDTRYPSREIVEQMEGFREVPHHTDHEVVCLRKESKNGYYIEVQYFGVLANVIVHQPDGYDMPVDKDITVAQLQHLIDIFL